jgi:hypothetical protein
MSRASSQTSGKRERQDAVLKMTMLLLQSVDGVYPYDVHAAMQATCAVGLIGEDLSALAEQGLIRRIPPRGHYGLPLQPEKPQTTQVVTEEPFIKPPSLARRMGCK